jgi:hypothetical protein
MSTNEDILLADQSLYNEAERIEEEQTQQQAFEAGVTPKLIQERTAQEADEGEDPIPRREFEPIAVTRMGGTLPWNADSTTLQCNQTVTDVDGDDDFRLNYEASCTLAQLRTLQEMRAAPEAVRLVAPLYNGPVSFDQLKVERLPDANGGVRRGEGADPQPRYTIQLQTKENTTE